MKFALIQWLWAAPALALLCLGLVRWGARRRRQSLDRVVAPRLHESLVRSVDYRKRALKTGLWVVGLVLLLASLARPLLGLREVQVERAGVDVILALDVSRSMLAEDAATNRLAAAKAALQRLLDRPSRDRYGLIIFAGEAFLSAPVTQDHGAVQRTVGSLTTTAVSKPGTDLAAAIKLALRSYDETHKKGKALVLLSDGEQLQGDAVIAAREAILKGVAIFTVGIGSPLGARVPDRAGGQLRFAKNEFGREVVSRLNENVLRQVAAAGRGFYAPLGKDGDGLIDVSERGVQPLAKGTQTRLSQDLREYFQWPLGLALALFFLEVLITDRKKSVERQTVERQTVERQSVRASERRPRSPLHAPHAPRSTLPTPPAPRSTLPTPHAPRSPLPPLHAPRSPLPTLHAPRSPRSPRSCSCSASRRRPTRTCARSAS